MVVPDPPHRLIGDNGYDSDKLDAELRHCGIEVIAVIAGIEGSRHKTNVVCGDTAAAGKSRDYLLGCKTCA